MLKQIEKSVIKDWEICYNRLWIPEFGILLQI